MTKTKICRACDKEKPVSQFHSSGGQTRDGLKPRCKQCVLEKKLIPKYKFGVKVTDDDLFNFDDEDLKIVAPKKSEYMLMYELIKRLGYSPQNAHIDFCKKWGLNPKYKAVRTQPVFLPNGEKNPLFKPTWFPKK